MVASPAAAAISDRMEAAGVVTDVDDGVSGVVGPLAVGDEVFSFAVSGAYATEVTAPGISFVPKPKTLSGAQAAGPMVTGTTAVHALTAANVSAHDLV